MPRHLTLILTALVLFPGIVPGQDQKIEEADKAVDAARTAVDAAELKLAEQYSLLRCDFEFIRSDSWVRLRPPVLAGVRAAGDACRKDPGLDPAEEVRQQISKARLLAGVTVEMLSAEVGRRLAEAGDSKPEEIFAKALGSLFPEEQFERCWPALLPRLTAVKGLEAAHRALGEAVAARKALDVTPGDPNAPPGMVLVPKGRFKFGPWTGWDADLEAARISNKQKSVREQGFFIDVHEVTNAEFREFLEGLGSRTRVEEYLSTSFTLSEDGTVASPPGKDAFPVVGVTLSAAMAYARSVGKRLPTEAEWEKAARGEDGRTYPWGLKLDEEAANWKGRKLDGPTAVGAQPKDLSPYGVLDMAGNVSEFTLNLDGRRPVKGKLEATDSVVTRGGNFEEGREALKNSYRWVLPADGGKSDTVGFRCVIAEKDWPK